MAEELSQPDKIPVKPDFRWFSCTVSRYGSLPKNNANGVRVINLVLPDEVD